VGSFAEDRVRRLKAMLAALLGAGALMAPAAEAEWTIDGRGFGHGVGMSQYGAYGFALAGRGYRDILDHYYTDTKVGKVGGERVRVLLGSGDGSVSFSGAGRACGQDLDPARDYSFEAGGGGVVLRTWSGDRLRSCGTEGEAAGGVRIGRFGSFRGALVARNSGGSLMVINALGLEAYVKGVVPNEVPTSWPAEALRAQAVAARSYGLATERSGVFDHYADARSQVYGGRSSEVRSTSEAVRATRRQVVEYRGRPAATYFFSTSGGQTESSEFGFSGGSSVPYLKSVEDPFDDASPVHTWTERLSDDQMESELDGLFQGKLRKIEILERGESPRIVRARVVGSSGSTTVTGDTLRARLGLRSTWARFERR